MKLVKPENAPQLGFYRHFKHDPHGLPQNYLYEVMGLAWDVAGLDGQPIVHVLYRPLYVCDLYEVSRQLNTPCLFSRSLKDWNGPRMVEGKFVPRFVQIDDPTEMASLASVRNRMYPQ